LALQLLKPKLLSGYEGAAPIEMKAALRDACYALIFPNLSESRRLFLTRLPGA
jgi:hypothetical protein